MMKNIDIYGEPVEILINKKHFIRTTIGGFFTILTILLVFIFTWFTGKDIVYKENPISYTQNYIFEKYLNFNITNKNFPFSFGLTDDSNIPLFDESFMKIKLYFSTYGINETNNNYQRFSRIEIPLKACNYSDFPNIAPREFDNAQLGFTICPADLNFNLRGYWNEEVLSFLQISIELCKNTSAPLLDNNSHITNKFQNKQNPICKSPQEIRDYISNTSTNLNIYYIDTKVIINNNERPIEFVTKASYKYIIPEYSKRTIFQIQRHTINTDDGFIFQSTNKVNFLKMIEDFTDISMISNDLEQLLVFEIYSSNISQTYFRRYVKISDILASMGGVLKIFSFIFFYLNIIFSRVQKYVSIINEVFILNKRKMKLSCEENLAFGANKNFNLNFHLNNENENFHCSSERDLKKNEDGIAIEINNNNNNNNNDCNNNQGKNDPCALKNECFLNQLNSNENNHSKNLLLLNENSCNKNNYNTNDLKIHEHEKQISENTKPDKKSKQNAIEKNMLLIKWGTYKPHSQSNSHSNSVKSSTIKKKTPKALTFKGFENIKIQDLKSNKINKERSAFNICSNIANENLNNKSNLKPASEFQAQLEEDSNKKLNKICKYPNVYKFLSLRNNTEKIEFTLKNIFRVACVLHCRRKIPEYLKENYLFFKKGKESVNNYFDLVYMIKKFEEIKIMKFCILNFHQLRMLELLNKPLLTINSNDIVEKNTFKNKRWIQISNESEDYGFQVDEFLKKANSKNNIDKNIISLMEHYENI